MKNTGLLNTLPTVKNIGWPWNEETPVDLYKEHTKWPKISIVTPSYNQGMFLEETLRSVLLQNYPNLEYIVIDGGSKDRSLTIIKKYTPWLTYWVSERDNGQSDAINKGLVYCGGEIFNWINSDDLYLPGALYQVGKAYLEKEFDIFAAYSHHFQWSKSKITFPNDRIPILDSIEKTIADHYYSQIGSFYKRSIFTEFDGVSEEKRYVMDVDLWLKYLLKKGSLKDVVLSDEVVALFRIHDLSKTGSGLEKFKREAARMMYNITRLCDAPQYFQEEHIDRHDRCNYCEEELEISPNINKRALLAHYYRRYPEYFYEKKNYESLKRSLLFLLGTSFSFWTTTNLSLAVKSFFIPHRLLNSLRNRKNKVALSSPEK